MFCSVNSSLSSHQVEELFRLSYYVHQEQRLSGESLTSLNEIKALNIQVINNNNVSNKHLGFYYFTPHRTVTWLEFYLGFTNRKTVSSTNASSEATYTICSGFSCQKRSLASDLMGHKTIYQMRRKQSLAFLSPLINFTGVSIGLQCSILQWSWCIL